MITKAEIQSIKALADKRGRVEQGCFIAEGEKLVAELLNLMMSSIFDTGAENSFDEKTVRQEKQSISDAIDAMQLGMLVDMVEIDIKNAWYSLGEILGEEIGDSLLDELFSKFCLGK